MNKLSLSLIVATGVLSTSAIAKSSVDFNERFEVPANSVLELNVPVGQVDIETYEGNEIILDVVVTESDDAWFSSTDWDEIQLEKDISGKTVSLEIDAEDTKQEWTLRIPKDASIDLDIGVGEVDIEDAARDVKVDMGVGSTDIELESDDYRSIYIETGVGDASLKGFDNIESTRSVVSEEISWRGEGKYMISVDVGVGDASVRY
jgi:hypothetical protein